MYTHQIWVSAEAQAGFLLTGVPSVLQGTPEKAGNRFYYRYTTRVEQPAYPLENFIPMPDLKHYRHEVLNEYGNLVSVEGYLTGNWKRERRDKFEQHRFGWFDI